MLPFFFLTTDRYLVAGAGNQGIQGGEEDDAQEQVGGKATHDDDGKGPL